MEIKCKICNKILKNNQQISQHVLRNHNIKLINYMVKYENFIVPKCIFCKKNARLKSGLRFKKTCCSKECILKNKIGRTHTEDIKKILKDKRLLYLKEHPEKTSWRKGNTPSYPELIFIDCLKKYNLLEEFEIEREKCFYPYYVDFAFINIKLAVEIDGSQHELLKNKIRDNKKELLIIKEYGWKLFRIKADQLLQDPKIAIEELKDFIGNNYEKSYTSKIITSKQKRKKELEKKRKIREINKNNTYLKRIEDIKRSDKSRGWIKKLSIKWNISHTQVIRWIKENMVPLCNGSTSDFLSDSPGSNPGGTNNDKLNCEELS